MLRSQPQPTATQGHRNQTMSNKSTAAAELARLLHSEMGAPEPRKPMDLKGNAKKIAEALADPNLDGFLFVACAKPNVEPIGLTDHSLVSVIAPDSMTADSLTKVVSVLGPEKGLKLIEATPGVAAHVMREPGEKLEAYETSRFAKYYE